MPILQLACSDYSHTYNYTCFHTLHTSVTALVLTRVTQRDALNGGIKCLSRLSVGAIRH